MPKEVKQIRVFISCPGDVVDEANIVEDICKSISAAYRHKNIEVISLYWERDFVSEITGEGAPAVIEDRLEEYDYDVYLGIMWKRFGDKLENGLTPTEGEFEKAYDRMQKTGRPVIQFYFKVSDYQPIDDNERAQMESVQNFKRNKIAPLGLYQNFDISHINDFEEKKVFYNKVNFSLLYIIDKLDLLTSKEIKVPKIEYKTISQYLRRQVSSVNDYGAHTAYFVHDLSKDITDVIREMKRISLICDAGVGKTTELNRIASYYSDSDADFYPILISLNKYTNQDIQELLSAKKQEWDKVPQTQLLVILDGLDEIENINRKTAIRKIESFCENYPDVHLVVSCRTNFYKSNTNQSIGTLDGFDSYVLLNLEHQQIDDYLESNLGSKKEDFIEAINLNRLYELLKVPFYLIRLVDLYKANGSLPKTKSEVFEQLLQLRIKSDVEHFRTTLDLDEKLNLIIETLERVALGMEILGRNYITNDEYHKIVTDESTRDILKYSTVWKKFEGEEIGWQFEHRNFQEYLAARSLSDRSFDTIKELVSFQPEYKKIIPSWINTLSFLVSRISKDSSLFNNILCWIMENEPEQLIRIEPDKLDESVRLEIFKGIFQYYKDRQIRISSDKYRFDEIARFVQSDDIADFLLSELDDGNHHTTIYNSLSILRYINISNTNKKQTEDILLHLSITGDFNDRQRVIISSVALRTLADLSLNTEDVVETVVSSLSSSENDWIRYSLYYFLRHSDYLDDRIDVFLDGIGLCKYKPYASSRIINERVELVQGLENVKSPSGIKKILAYFIRNPNDILDLFLDNSISRIAKNSAAAYKQDNSILGVILEFTEILAKNYHTRQLKQLRIFFEESGTPLKIFQDLLSKNKFNTSKKNILLTLASLANLEAIKYFVQRYEDKFLKDDDVIRFQGYLAQNNRDIYRTFNTIINKKSADKFLIQEMPDLNEEGKKRTQKDIDILFGKTDFLREINQIFERERKVSFTSHELAKVKLANWKDPYFTDIVINTLVELSQSQPITFQIAKQEINKMWDSYSVWKIYERLQNNTDIILDDDQKKIIAKWCNDNLDNVDFSRAMEVVDNGRTKANPLAVCLWYFLREYDLKYPKKILLDMLSFDWIDNVGMVGIVYLENLLDENEMTKRILKNLKTGIKDRNVLRNHIDYCKRHRVREVIPFARSEIVNSDRDHEVRALAVETMYELSGNLSDLEAILPDIKDDFKWDLVDHLIKRNSIGCRDYLKGILKNGSSENEKLKASFYLINLDTLDGLEYYVNWVKKNKKNHEYYFYQSPLIHLRQIDSLDLLIELLEISYQDEFYEDGFNRLNNDVLNALSKVALRSDENYNKVKTNIERFISEKLSMIKNVNFLNTFLEQLEGQFYTLKSDEIDIDAVVRRLNEILQ